MIWNVAGMLGAGSSGDYGPGELAQLDGPLGVAFDAEGNLYIAEAHRVRKVAAPRADCRKFDCRGRGDRRRKPPGRRHRARLHLHGLWRGHGAGGRFGHPRISARRLALRCHHPGDAGHAEHRRNSAVRLGGQINAIMPSDAPLGVAQLQVLYAGFPSAPVTIKVVPTNFQFFVADDRSMGIFQAVASPSDYPLCTREAPAHPGQIVIAWGTGLGAGAGPDSLSPQGISLPVDVEVLVGGRPAQVVYKGRAPTFAGVDNLYFAVPGDAPTGCRVPVQVRAGGVDSEPVTIAISTGGPCQE